MKPAIHQIFNIHSAQHFKNSALSIFNYQAVECDVYRQYIDTLKINHHKIDTIAQIPFLPIEFFKTHEVRKPEIENGLREKPNKKQETKGLIFTSSGTTSVNKSKHYVNDITIYEKSYSAAFRYFYGNIEDYCILALLPSYLERDGSSLVYMVSDLISKSEHPQSGFYLNNYTELLKTVKQLEENNQKTILLGVSYALLDLAELMITTTTLKFKNTIVMETGGMKGKRQEMVKEELHKKLCEGFGVNTIHSEYGMTELLSQAYSKEKGLFYCPPWMNILIRDVNDPFSFLPQGKTGGINVIDLANINSCSFIATQDLGKLHVNNSFEVLGRFDSSDIRGCNLLVE